MFKLHHIRTKIRPEVLFFQEAAQIPFEQKVTQKKLKMKGQWNNNPNAVNIKNGLAILVPNDAQIHNTFKDNKALFMIMDCSIDDVRYTMVNVHMYTHKYPNKLQELINTVLEIGNKSLIIGGDFNDTMDAELDILNTYQDPGKFFNRFMYQNGFS